MKTQYTEEQRYILTKKKVEKISKFYKHLVVYVVVNTFLSAIFIVGDINEGDTFTEAFFNYHNYKIWFFWGIGVVFQALNVFGLNIFFNKDWEQKKINEYLKK
ncbi:2TM domain-containing protein [Polaribacter sp. Asnod1-A03]|uniref:2TM domain-containing protein n=1 Tax=Polaribacter sp. Asnod1-A03 TaxID=3160581 RepID=UPI003863862B